ncbi:hypothetical protein ABTQ33_05695 [Paucilactobacillus suebicus]|nr:hypothetical protein [Paucilactobacillus suebicus]
MVKINLNTPLHIDFRHQETQAKLFNSLQQFYNLKTPFNTITVTQLCADAHVGRATFYRNHEKIDDIIYIQFLILINDFKLRVDDRQEINFQYASQLIVQLIIDNINLFNLMEWSNIEKQITELFSGTVHSILINRSAQLNHADIISNVIGSSILNFAVQITKHSDLLSVSEATKLYQILIPDLPANQT